MTRVLSLAHLTAIGLTPAQLIRVAADAGLASVGLRLIRVTPQSPGYPLWLDADLKAETRAAMAETGVGVNDIEFVRITPDIDLDALDRFFETGAELGAREVITAPYDPDVSRLADRLGALGERAAGFGLEVSLEFFPWTPEVADLAAALRVASAAGPKIGVLVDALHFDRSGSSLELLRAVPADRLRLAHVCDAPVAPPYSTDVLLETAREKRLVPGEGGIDLAAFVAALPRSTALGIEVPMAEVSRTEGDASVVVRAVAATRRVLAAAGDARDGRAP